ncbi:MAG: hypothetical protein EZS28_012779 [Streblomastix strix]|uniref:Uncharacterized protein n=1 Tax=Streblomastix strix TaxID=222440 RepID=A0A5J4WAZ3_9EUKA|nr:MAG: hypothetical protein EZS28_012779 [Streblomastix strix]
MTLFIIILIIVSLRSLSNDDYLFYQDEKIGKNGVLTLNFGYETTNFSNTYKQSVKIAKFPIREENTSSSDHAYVQSFLKTDDISQQQFAQRLTASEIQCRNVVQAHNRDYYGLIGFTERALEMYTPKSTFAPSISYLIKNGPSLVTFKDLPAQQYNQQEAIEIQQTCDSDNAIDYLPFALRSAGVASSECIPNSQIPESTSKCTNGDKMKVKLKGYTLGSFEDMSASVVKGLILRFGAVQLDAFIVLGWVYEKWVAAVRDSDEYKYTGLQIPINEDAYYNGSVIFQPSVPNDVMIALIATGAFFAVAFIILAIIFCYCTHCMLCEDCCLCSCPSCRAEKCCPCCFRKKSSYNDTEQFNKNNAISDFPEGGQQMSDVSKPPIYATQPQQPTSYPAISSSNDEEPSQQLSQYPSSYTASVDE